MFNNSVLKKTVSRNSMPLSKTEKERQNEDDLHADKVVEMYLHNNIATVASSPQFTTAPKISSV